MIVLDRLLISGVKFVLTQLENAANAERNDDTALREELMLAELQLELGEITPAEYATKEAELLLAMRQTRDDTTGLSITGVEVSTVDTPVAPARRRKR